MMTGNGVMHNGTTVIEQYGQNLDRLQVGDRVGVVRKDDGTLHFWVNGVDQGPGATNVPERVYGVIGRGDDGTNVFLLLLTNFFVVGRDRSLRPGCAGKHYRYIGMRKS